MRKNYLLILFFAGLFLMNLYLLVSNRMLNSKLEKNEKQLTDLTGHRSPSLKFDMYAYDFAKIRNNKEARVKFTFTNTSLKSATISNIETSCGCTDAKWDTVVNAGRKGVVEIGYDGVSLGQFTKYANVYIEGEKEPVKLAIEGFVEKDRKELEK